MKRAKQHKNWDKYLAGDKIGSGANIVWKGLISCGISSFFYNYEEKKEKWNEGVQRQKQGRTAHSQK